MISSRTHRALWPILTDQFQLLALPVSTVQDEP